MLRKIAYWILWNVPCGRFAPRLLGFAVGCKGYKKIEKKDSLKSYLKRRMEMDKKVIFLTIVDGKVEDYNNLVTMLSQISSDLPYNFVLTQRPIQSLGIDELRKTIERELKDRLDDHCRVYHESIG